MTQQQGGAGLVDMGPAQTEAAVQTQAGDPGPAQAGDPGPAQAEAAGLAQAGDAGPAQAEAAGPAQAEAAGLAQAGDTAPAPAETAEAAAEGVPGIVSAWRALAARHAAVSAALERELGERHGLGVTEFEVLERLAEDQEHQFRVQELAEAVHLSQSALSRLIGRLEQHGLVERSLCDLDRRGIYVCLTEAGRRRHAEALPTQRAVLAAALTGA
jgi:DNA-binding MarR family transcriptional regulator